MSSLPPHGCFPQSSWILEAGWTCSRSSRSQHCCGRLRAGSSSGCSPAPGHLRAELPEQWENARFPVGMGLAVPPAFFSKDSFCLLLCGMGFAILGLEVLMHLEILFVAIFSLSLPPQPRSVFPFFSLVLADCPFSEILKNRQSCFGFETFFIF